MPTITKTQIRQEVLRFLGGEVYDILSADSTSITVQALQHSTGDDNHYKNTPIYLPDQTDAATRRRVATAWDDSAGKFTVDTMGEDPQQNEDIEVYPRNDVTASDIDQAINLALKNTPRIVRSYLPTIQGDREYTLRNQPWIDTRHKILAVFSRYSPQLLDNESFELWGTGGDAELGAWTVAGTGATVTRVDGEFGRYAARLTATGGNVATLTQTIGLLNLQLQGKTIAVEARGKTSTASAAGFRISDGVGSDTDAENHDGDGHWEILQTSAPATITHTIDANATTLTFQFRMILDGTVDLELPIAVEGTSIPQWLSDFGSQHAGVRQVPYSVGSWGSGPVIQLESTQPRGTQIMVVSRQPYFTLAADTDVTDMPLDAAVSGTLFNLARIMRKSEDRTRWDEIGRVWEPQYLGWKRTLSEVKELNPTPRHVLIHGA